MAVLLRGAHQILRCLWVGLLASSGCLWWAKRQLRGEGAVVVLTFHRILGDTGHRATNSLPGIVLRERTFRDLVAHVARRHEPVDLQEVVPGEPCRKLRVAFTFDDGWCDNHTVAHPVARAHSIPLTIFVCPALVDKNTPFWPERVVALLRAGRPAAAGDAEPLIEALKSCTTEQREHYLVMLSEQVCEPATSVKPADVDRTLSWHDIAEMDQAGVSFGSHTDTHQILTTVPADMARREVGQSKTAIESALNKRCDAFSYPNGNWSAEVRNILSEAGFKLAVTTERGAWTATCDRLIIPRLNVCEDNVVGPTGRFWPAMFEYMILWKAWRWTKANLCPKTPHDPWPKFEL